MVVATAPVPGNAGALTQSLDGKTILITGGASGLGAALCRVLAAEGARIVVAERNVAGAQEVLESLPPAPGGVSHCVLGLDVGQADAGRQAIDFTCERYGGIDILINNAGTDVTCALEELSYDDWDRVMRTNLYGPFLLTRAAIPVMKRQGAGQIINIASTAAKRAWPNAGAYHASKWGLLGLSHGLHAELRPFNIRVTAVIAGGMRTPFLLERFPDLDPALLQDPANVAAVIRGVLLTPAESVVPEITILPMQERSWP